MRCSNPATGVAKFESRDAWGIQKKEIPDRKIPDIPPTY